MPMDCTVGRKVEQQDQKRSRANIDGEHANHPYAFPPFQLAKDQKNQQGQQQIEQVELLGGAFEITPELQAVGFKKADGFFDEIIPDAGGGVNGGILAAGYGVNETVDRPGISPLHRRVGHAGDGFVKIESRAQNPDRATDQNDEPFLGKVPGLFDEIGKKAARHDGGNNDQKERRTIVGGRQVIRETEEKQLPGNPAARASRHHGRTQSPVFLVLMTSQIQSTADAMPMI